jgi:hypothetical protein
MDSLVITVFIVLLKLESSYKGYTHLLHSFSSLLDLYKYYIQGPALNSGRLFRIP